MSIEDRLVRDIATVTGGVIVMESDLQEARKAVNDRIYTKRPRVRLRSATAVAAAAVVLAAAGIAGFLTFGDDDRASQPANPGPAPISDPVAEHLTGQAPTAQLLKGVWRVDNGKILVQFREDGTVRFDDQGTLFSRPTTTGTYAIAGDTITVTTTSDAQQNCIGSTYAMRAALAEVGVLHYVDAATAVSPCAPLPPTGLGALEQALPTGAALAGGGASADDNWQPLTDKAVLAGVWIAEGGGHLLEIDAAGTYYVADASAEPIDRGNWSLRGSDLTLTSAAGSARCSAGDTLVLGAAQSVTFSTLGLRGTVRQNTCGGAWTPVSWLLLPNATN